MSETVERYVPTLMEQLTAGEPKLTEAQAMIGEECDEIRSMLIEKNRRYGNSALQPMRVFATSDTMEQIRVRIDDKLSRMLGLQPDDTDDVEMDLIGYLVLLRVARRMT